VVKEGKDMSVDISIRGVWIGLQIDATQIYFRIRKSGRWQFAGLPVFPSGPLPSSSKGDSLINQWKFTSWEMKERGN
jgi:hypothetical protein